MASRTTPEISIRGRGVASTASVHSRISNLLSLALEVVPRESGLGKPLFDDGDQAAIYPEARMSLSRVQVKATALDKRSGARGLGWAARVGALGYMSLQGFSGI